MLKCFRKLEEADKTFRETTQGDSGEGLVPQLVPLWGYAVLRQGRVRDALEMLSSTLQTSLKVYDERSLTLWENRAFHALAVGASGEREEAVKTLSVALPKILEMSRPEGTSGEAGLFNTTRLNWLLDGYVSFLSELYNTGRRVEGVDLVGEAFRYSDIARASRVQGALTAAIVRASQSDPNLAAVIRRSQDLEYQVQATAQYLTALQSQPSSAETEKLITAKRAELEQLRVENEKAQQESNKSCRTTPSS